MLAWMHSPDAHSPAFATHSAAAVRGKLSSRKCTVGVIDREGSGKVRAWFHRQLDPTRSRPAVDVDVDVDSTITRTACQSRCYLLGPWRQTTRDARAGSSAVASGSSSILQVDVDSGTLVANARQHHRTFRLELRCSVRSTYTPNCSLHGTDRASCGDDVASQGDGLSSRYPTACPVWRPRGAASCWPAPLTRMI